MQIVRLLDLYQNQRQKYQAYLQPDKSEYSHGEYVQANWSLGSLGNGTNHTGLRSIVGSNNCSMVKQFVLPI